MSSWPMWEGPLCPDPIHGSSRGTKPLPHSSNPLLRGRPDELVHLELKTHRQLVRENPIHDLARIDPAEDRRKQNRAAALRQAMALYLFTRPFVVLTRTDDELHLIALRQVLDVREKVAGNFTAPWRF